MSVCRRGGLWVLLLLVVVGDDIGDNRFTYTPTPSPPFVPSLFSFFLQVRGNKIQNVWVGEDTESLTTNTTASEDDVISSECFQHCLEIMTGAGLRGRVEMHYHNYNTLEVWG